MQTGRELILATKPYTTESSRRSWWCVLSTAALTLAALAGTIWNVHWLGKLACSVLTGLLVLRMFVIYHDHQHASILSNSRLAGLLMRGFGIIALAPSSIWRSSHNYHHNHNSKLRSAHIGSFPIMTREQFTTCSPRKRRNYLFMRHPLTILFGYVFVFLHGMCVYPFVNNPKKHYDCLVALTLHIALGTTLVLLLGWQGLLLTQVIPCLITYCIGSYLFYVQHNFPDVVFREQAVWSYEKAALESSSFLKTGRVMAWFTANIGYHHIHHLNARIPFYRLPEVMRDIPALQNPSITTLWPTDVYRCLRLKVWDAGARQMIPLSKV